MNNKIIYLDNNEENIFKHDLMKQLREYILSKNERVSVLSQLYEILLYSKYLIEKNNLDYFKISNGDIDELMNLLIQSNYFIRLSLVLFKKQEIYKFIGKIAFEDYRIEIHKDRILDNCIDNNKKYLLISTNNRDYVSYSNVDIYIENDKHLININRDKIYDEIQNINRNYYIDLKDIDINIYDEIIYINDNTNYISYTEFRKKLLKESNQLFTKEVFMITNYSNISNYIYEKDNIILRENEINVIKNIMIDNNKAYILYDYKNRKLINDTKINIKELSNIKDEDIKEYINNDKEIDNISIYVDRESIINNNYRIGFNAYNKKIDNKKILMLIDRNTTITKRIRELDEEISNQIDRMIIK